jgi:hypothetical protein
MIAINDTTSFSGLDFEQNNVFNLIPSSSEINLLIPNNTFVNTAITTTFKNLLVDISNSCIGVFASVSENVKNRASQMFNTIGFYRNSSGTIQFMLNTDALNQGTSMIINFLHDIKNYNDKAYNAFHNNSWAKRANDIRGMTSSGLKKQHHITVTKLDVNSTIQDINNLANLINNTAVNNRFAVISANPTMPRIKIRNNSDVSLKVRLKIKFKKTRYANGTGDIYRVFLDHFPNQNSSDHTDTVGGVHVYSKIIPSQGSWEIDYEGKIRGGDATIEYIENSLVWSDASIYKFTFNIRARNPLRQNVLNYLNENRPNGSYLSRFWFIMRLIRHESGTHQGNEFLHFNSAPNNSYLYNNNQMGLPSFGPPRGFGLGQIDNDGQLTSAQIATLGLTEQIAEIQAGAAKEYQTIVHQGITYDNSRRKVASDDQVWNWKRNIDKIVSVIESKIDAIDGDIDDMRDSVIAWNNAHPTNQVVVPAPINYDTIQFKWLATQIDELESYNNLFQQGTSPTLPTAGTRTLKSFYDAMLIKSYNGNSGGGTFMEMSTSGGKPSFQFNLLNNIGFNYVERISNTND